MKETNKPFRGINFGKESIEIGPVNNEMKPTLICLKEDGAIGDKPSLAILFESYGKKFIGQVSVDMFNEGLDDIGYKLVKKV